MISPNAKNLESVLLAEPRVAVIVSCRTLTCSAKVSCRTLKIAEPNALISEKDYLLSASKSQRCLRFAIAMPTRKNNAALRFKGAMESR